MGVQHADKGASCVDKHGMCMLKYTLVSEALKVKVPCKSRHNKMSTIIQNPMYAFLQLASFYY